jgi:hypothetical protein
VNHPDGLTRSRALGTLLHVHQTRRSRVAPRLSNRSTAERSDSVILQHPRARSGNAAVWTRGGGRAGGARGTFGTSAVVSSAPADVPPWDVSCDPRARPSEPVERRANRRDFFVAFFDAVSRLLRIVDLLDAASAPSSQCLPSSATRQRSGPSRPPQRPIEALTAFGRMLVPRVREHASTRPQKRPLLSRVSVTAQDIIRRLRALARASWRIPGARKSAPYPWITQGGSELRSGGSDGWRGNDGA